MNLHGQIDAACENRPGRPQPCHWSVWIVLECGFHGFQFLRDCAGFWQIQSHINSNAFLISNPWPHVVGEGYKWILSFPYKNFRVVTTLQQTCWIATRLQLNCDHNALKLSPLKQSTDNLV